MQKKLTFLFVALLSLATSQRAAAKAPKAPVAQTEPLADVLIADGRLTVTAKHTGRRATYLISQLDLRGLTLDQFVDHVQRTGFTFLRPKRR